MSDSKVLLSCIVRHRLVTCIIRVRAASSVTTFRIHLFGNAPQSYLRALSFAHATAKPPAACQPKKRSALAPQAKRLLSQFTSDLGDAIQQTADQAGRLPDYLDAMSEYRSAARLGSWSEAA